MVITGASRDPVYASGFFTAALGVAPVFEAPGLGVEGATGATRWRRPSPGVTLSSCRTYAATPEVRHDAADDGALRPVRGAGRA